SREAISGFLICRAIRSKPDRNQQPISSRQRGRGARSTQLAGYEEKEDEFDMHT
ncbi:20917_t:CDS:2, partial [Gigaspora margarita]